MSNLKRVALVAASLGLLAGCSAKAPNTAAIESMIRAHTTAWVDAYNSGDADKIVAGYADDAVLMPPEAPAAVGREAMKQYLVGDMATSKAAGNTLALDNDSIGMSGDLAWHSGNFHVNGSGGTSVGTGKYLEVWHQVKDNWLIIRDTWNTDAPAVAALPPPAPAPKPAASKAAPKKKHKKK
jgi:ketosteroid isomerase-like protein